VLSIGGTLALGSAVYTVARIRDGSLQAHVAKLALRLAAAAPGKAGAKVAKDKDDAITHLKAGLMAPDPPGVQAFRALPAVGLPHADVLAQLEALRVRDDAHWKGKHGRVSGCVYYADSEHHRFLAAAQEKYLISNPLHPDVWPSLTKMESEVCHMARDLLHGDAAVSGVVTSGGTESILLALKMYRDYGAAVRGITRPQVVMCQTAHAAFDKAAQYFNIELVKVPCDPLTFAMDVAATRRAMSSRVVAIVGSAPQYPHGAVDNIEALAAIARQYGCGLHVDGCLGGFLLPFLVAHGVDLGTKFDFLVPEVTSMSADTHKYGYSTKGTSVLLVRGTELKHHMYFCTAEWPGGVYASPTIAGSRPGALSVGCWASLVSIGRDGYMKLAAGIIGTFNALKAAVARGDAGPLRILGDTRAMILAFDRKTDADPDIQRWCSGMAERGWNLNRLQDPNAVHICLTAALIGCEHDFISDSKAVFEALVADPALHASGAARIYGMTAALPGALKSVLIADLVNNYLDAKTDL
jgi:sphinganine-1-phosphate aldolase